MFAKCEMQMVNFMGTELHETKFYQCDLRKADFRDATGYKVDILGSRLKDAKFSLPEAVNLLADLKIKLSLTSPLPRQPVTLSIDGKILNGGKHFNAGFL